jgi:CPA1 family monovalent cation:H+ antiporter
MRGAVSLAAALAIPLAISGGGPFPDRNLIIFLTFCVILATLVLQGLTLPALIRRLGIAADRRELGEETAARLAATQAALERLETLARQGLPTDLVDDLRAQLANESRWYADRVTRSDGAREALSRKDLRAVRLDLLAAEREAIIDLRDQEIIGDDAFRAVESDLDLEQLILET